MTLIDNYTNAESQKQVLFREMVLGILVYAVVLGFFEDYTNIINTWSYSVTFMVAVVMQILTYLTFEIKKLVTRKFKQKNQKAHFAVLAFLVWLIMFISKFVFLATIDVIFGNSVEMSGFVGIILIIACMSVVKKSIDLMYLKLV